jgi:hypothetical protein
VQYSLKLPCTLIVGMIYAEPIEEQQKVKNWNREMESTCGHLSR